jgi:hypothetical protein
MTPRTEFSRRQFSDLSELQAEVAAAPRKPQVQPAPIKFNGELNRYYETRRNGAIKKVWLVEVRKDQAIIKDNENDKHSRRMSLAEFVKFYA